MIERVMPAQFFPGPVYLETDYYCDGKSYTSQYWRQAKA